jgi:hypothetical protein
VWLVINRDFTGAADKAGLDDVKRMVEYWAAEGMTSYKALVPNTEVSITNFILESA